MIDDDGQNTLRINKKTLIQNIQNNNKPSYPSDDEHL